MSNTSAKRSAPPQAEISKLWNRIGIESGRSTHQVINLSELVEWAAKLFPSSSTRRAMLVGDLVLWREHAEHCRTIGHRVADLLSQCMSEPDEKTR